MNDNSVASDNVTEKQKGKMSIFSKNGRTPGLLRSIKVILTTVTINAPIRHYCKTL